MTATLEQATSETYDTWGTLNTAAEPCKLIKGQTPRAVNAFPDEKPGSIVTVPGLTKVGELPSGNPCRFKYTFERSDGTASVLLSDNMTVYETRDFITFTTIVTGLSQAFQLRAVTLRDKAWLTNGNDAVRTYNGTTVVVLDGTSSTPNVPKGRFIEVWQERIWLGDIPGTRSAIRFSSLTDSSGADIAPDNAAAWPTINQIQFGQDDGDVVCALKLYLGRLHTFKAKSIYRVDGNDVFTYEPYRTTATTGSRIQESIQERDNLLEFIGINGVYQFDGNSTEKVTHIIESLALDQFSFNNIQQGSNQQRSRLWTDQLDFEAGTLTRTSASRDPDFVIIDGFTYSAATLPLSDPDNPWTTLGTGPESVSGGILSIQSLQSHVGDVVQSRFRAYRRTTDTNLNNAAGTEFTISGKHGGDAAQVLYLQTGDGTRLARIHISKTNVAIVDNSFVTVVSYAMTTTDTYHIYRMIVLGDTVNVYVDGTLRLTWAANTTLNTTKLLEFGVLFGTTNAGYQTSTIDYVSVIFSTTTGSQAISEVYHITDTISLWGAFQATYQPNGGTLTFSIRSGASSAACLAASWTTITPGATIAFAVGNVYIQWRAEFESSGTSSPSLEDVTINWNTGSATVASSQPVASIVFKDRYWLSGASLDSSTNNTVIIRGKRLYDTPWILLEGFNILAFCIYNNQLYASSSTNSDLYRLDTGHSLNGFPMRSSWELRDELGGPDEIFYKRMPIVIVAGQLKGNYNLDVDASIDGGLTYPAIYHKTISLSGAGRFQKELRYDSLRGKQVRIRVQTNGVDEPFDISSIRIFWIKKFLR